MRLRSSHGYTATAMTLHWLILALLIVQFIVAWTMPHIGRNTKPATLISLHFSIGVTILAVAIVRLAWRLTHTAPAPEAGVPLLFGVWVLGLPLRGSIAATSMVCLVGALAFGGIGLLLASRARTFEAISGLMNLTMVPMWVLSGVFFSSSNFPQAVQPLIHALPLTALVDALRSVVLDGAGLAAVSRELAILAGWGLGGFAIALRIFRWT